MQHHPNAKTDCVDTAQLLRMPWTNSDNAFSWLEITRRCDLECGYCYQTNDPRSDKAIFQVKKEMEALMHQRKCDTMFISGGEPLLHPQLEEVVKIVKSFKVKPVLVTNGHKLTPEKVANLRKAGAFGFIIHVDSGQGRPGWGGKSEKELNILRQQYADMIHREGGLVCGFNTTVLPETLHEVSDIAEWTVRNIRKVCTNTFIPVRVPREDDPWELYVRGKKIEFRDTVFSKRKYKNPSKKILLSQDLYCQVQKAVPRFRANAFLGGTEVADAPKWLFGNVIGTDKKVFGTFGAKTIEILQNGYHLLTGRYLSFLKPRGYRMGRLLFIFGFVDKQVRDSFLSFLAAVIRNPLRLFRKVSVQSLLIMQPQDVLPTGEQDLCDGCPNKTYHEGRLVSMCRKEEYLHFGGIITLKEKEVGNTHITQKDEDPSHAPSAIAAL